MTFRIFSFVVLIVSVMSAGAQDGKEPSQPNKAGIYDFIPGLKKSQDLRHLVNLQKREETIPERLKTVGYSTALVGKWQCGSLFNNRAQPQPDYFGFDYWFATHTNASPSHENLKKFVRNGENVGPIEGFSCQIVVDKAFSWLDKKDNDNPFYLQVIFHEPIALLEEIIET
ncbi:sulfatase-like hydrolase/transferase [Zobellia barbeyronii]|uniref:Sulfatase-like hydrolase/transferase n=1 Tax=Zobellia barbeyronii TaxID=2748009 RepID=A0ABS5WF93_9FLAO|nr:sulfatase-like hydrolase/transferase [Zobellia barbeyronii]MBT2161530.1 sulfatase-like hydrolase/transferase [Zobellia barbeyronii]